ncbi:hypothetical protein ABW20_dc0109622 [Dactylellina cionopaga]|nr:hypothetical protein ABW20_dc0109622 [Dactylellina cionopaga]
MESPSEDALPSVGSIPNHLLPRIFIVAGPAATGKSTVARAIAAAYGLPMVEGDDLHSPENVAKMSHGEPLTDEDRWGWLQKISSVSLDTALAPTSPPGELDDARPNPPGCIATCSALKKSYRDLLRSQLSEAGLAVLRFKNMVHSQIVTAEVPKTLEGGDDGEEELEADCHVVWTDDLTQDEVVEKAVEVVKQIMLLDVGEEHPSSDVIGDELPTEEEERGEGEEEEDA